MVRIHFPQPKLKKGGIQETSTVITSTAFKSVLEAIAEQISVTTVVEVLVYIVSISIALVFMWWGVRKATRSLMAAFRKGRLKI